MCPSASPCSISPITLSEITYRGRVGGVLWANDVAVNPSSQVQLMSFSSRMSHVVLANPVKTALLDPDALRGSHF